MCDRVEAEGGEVRKLKWIGRSHGPDRFVALNGAHLVECKRPGEHARPGQLREHRKLRNHKVSVFVVSTFEDVDWFIRMIT